jgi:hypothetical protein
MQAEGRYKAILLMVASGFSIVATGMHSQVRRLPMRLATIGALLVLTLTVAVQNQAWQKPDAKDTHAKGSATPLISSIEGPVLFRAYCASCHGMDAKGGGPMVASLRVKPADLTRIAARNGGVFPKMRVERIISGEEQPASGHGSARCRCGVPSFRRSTTIVISAACGSTIWRAT